MAVLLSDNNDNQPRSCLYDLLAGLVALLGVLGLVAMTAIGD